MNYRQLCIAAGIVFAGAVLLGTASFSVRSHVERIENRPVLKYFSETDYTSDDASVIGHYASEESPRKDRPEAFECKCPSGSPDMKLTLWDSYSDETSVKEADGTDGSVRITNLYPDALYTYTLSFPDGGGAVQRGWFFTDGTVRMLDIDGIYNVRDIGGLHAADGKTVRYGKVIRGCEMDGEHEINITEDGIAELRGTVGVRFDLDLRKDDEVDLLDDGQAMDRADHPEPITASALGEDIGYARIPIASYLHPWISDEEGQEEADGRKRYRDVFRIIFDCVEKDIPVYIHCRAGADRTGTICYLLEGLLGVGESELAKDYEMTSFASKFGIRSIDSDDYQQMQEYIAGGSNEPVSVSKFEIFFENMGFSQTEIEAFRAKMLG